MRVFLSALFLSFLLPFIHGTVPVPYAGKVSIKGVNFNGQLKFTFPIYTASNDMVWDSGGDPIEVPVSNGRYLVRASITKPCHREG